MSPQWLAWTQAGVVSARSARDLGRHGTNKVPGGGSGRPRALSVESGGPSTSWGVPEVTEEGISTWVDSVVVTDHLFTVEWVSSFLCL